MIEIAIHEIQPKHIEQAILGEELIFIKDGQAHKMNLTPENKLAKKSRKAGSAKGQIKMADDFDEPLDCFVEYIPNKLHVNNKYRLGINND